MGEDPPVFDILSWNADGTNLPAALHRQFLDIFEHNPLPEPGAMEALGTPIDLRQIKVPTYVTGAVNDHLTPWKGCYRTTQLHVGREHLRAEQRRSHRQPGQPAGQPQGQLLHRPARPETDRRRVAARAPRSTPAPGGSTGPTGPSSAPASRCRRPSSLGLTRFPAQSDAPGTYVRQPELSRDGTDAGLELPGRRGSGDGRESPRRVAPGLRPGPPLRKSISRSRSTELSPWRADAWTSGRAGSPAGVKHIRMARWIVRPAMRRGRAVRRRLQSASTMAGRSPARDPTAASWLISRTQACPVPRVLGHQVEVGLGQHRDQVARGDGPVRSR